MINIPIITADLVYRLDASTGEGAIWHSDRNTLFFVDIEGQKLYEYFPQENRTVYWMFDKMVTTVVPETKNTVIVALQNEIIRLHLDTKKIDSLVFIDDKNGVLRCNDGKCDPQGRLWIGTMVLHASQESAALYTFFPDGTIKKQLDKITISNGIGWSNDEQFLFYIDTPTQTIVRFAYDANIAGIKQKETIITILESTGSPDGMTIDKNGNLWVALWNGYGVHCYNPDTGELIAKIKVPVPNVTSCAFGGKDLDTLYIITARSGLSASELEKYPLSGSLFACKPGVCGIEAYRFRNSGCHIY